MHHLVVGTIINRQNMMDYEYRKLTVRG